MAPRGDDSGEMSGPGMMRDMDLRLVVDEGSCGEGPNGGRLGFREAEGSSRCASEGRRGVDSVVSPSLGRRDGLETSSLGDCQGLTPSGDCSPSLASPNARDMADEEKESKRCGV